MDEVQARLVEYLERTTDLVGVADDRGNVVHLNRAAREHLGLAPDDDQPLTTADLFPPEAFDVYYEQIRPRILLGQVWSGLLPLRRGAGEATEMWTTVVGEVLAGGEVAWLVMAARDVSEWRHIHDDPGRHATHDELTGVATRTLLMDHTDIALARARRTGGAAAVMFVDVDDLKAVNDSFGHQAGDAVLVEVARRLRDSVRAIDTVARVGGDEFVVLFDGVDDDKEAEQLATRVHALLESSPVDAHGVLVNVSASAGLAVTQGNEGGHQLLGRADAAMYESKGERQRPPLRAAGGEPHVRSVSVHDVAVAVTQRAIVPHYQPVIDLTTDEPVGVQALARWQHPDARPRLAASFIGVAESSGVGFTLDLAVLRDAVAAAAGHADAGRLYVHVSQRFLTRPGVARFVREVLHHSLLAPNRLGLVIPALLASRRAALVSEAVAALRDLDVRLVANLPVDHDPSDVDLAPTLGHLFEELRLGIGWLGAAPDPRELGALIDLAHERNMRARVTGVESDEHHRLLADLGCDLAEGRYFAPPSASLAAGANR